MSEFVVKINNKKKNVSLINDSSLTLEDKEYKFNFVKLSEHNFLFKLNNEFYEISVVQTDNENLFINIEGELFDTSIRTALQEKAQNLLEQKKAQHSKIDIKAPMPGMILKIKKEVGDSIEKGDTIIILEAMKMENEIRSPIKGILKQVLIKEGSAIEKGAALFSIE